MLKPRKVLQCAARILSAFLALGLAAGPARAEKLEITKKAGDYTLEARFDKNPPIVGKNELEIEVRNAAGGAVVGAKVMVQYYMPPMPRMAPMNYKIEAKLKKGKYGATLNLIMAGPWIFVVRILEGETTRTAKFSIDAR